MSFSYRDGVLACEGVAIDTIAENVPTPFYVYSTSHVLGQLSALTDALTGLDATVIYALKANDNPELLKAIFAAGAGADVVSGGELTKALEAGCPPEKIVFAGVGKTKRELRQALETGILQINVESEPELIALEAIAAKLGKVAPVALRLNPDVDAKTHAKITTGKSDNKFGIDFETARRLAKHCQSSASLSLDALSMHIGSQLLDVAPFRDAYRKLRAFAEEVGGLKRLDIGGGLGIRYRDETPIDPSAWAQVVREELGDLGLPLLTEPGRYLVGNAGVLVSEVIYVKQGVERDFLILDSGMNDLIRPAMYDAYHNIVPIKDPGDAPLSPIDIVGPICESGDTFAKQRQMPPIAEDELVAFESAGAYCFVMASTYNGRPLPKEVLVDGDSWQVV